MRLRDSPHIRAAAAIDRSLVEHFLRRVNAHFDKQSRRRAEAEEPLRGGSRLHPLVSLTAANEALAYIETGRSKGKVVVKVR